MTLVQKADPDESYDLHSNYCESCGEDLAQEAQALISKRQVIELPPIEPIYIEYRPFGCTCPNCRHEQQAAYPEGVRSGSIRGKCGESDRLLECFPIHSFPSPETTFHRFV